MILSSSPFCQYPLPYLLTKEGQKCTSRDFIAEKIYWSRYLECSGACCGGYGPGGSGNGVGVGEPLHLPQDDCEWVEKSVVNTKVTNLLYYFPYILQFIVFT